MNTQMLLLIVSEVSGSICLHTSHTHKSTYSYYLVVLSSFSCHDIVLIL